jgi:hypothetical protein
VLKDKLQLGLILLLCSFFFLVAADTSPVTTVKLIGDAEINVTKVGDNGAAHVAIFDSQTGVGALVTPAGALKVSEIAHLAGDAFGAGPLAVNKWDIVASGGGTQLEAGGELVLATNGGVNASIAVNTFARGRFYPGHFNTGHLAAQLSSAWASADTVAEWGVYDATTPLAGDGLFIRFTDGEFNIVTRRAGVETVVNESSFTGFIPAKNALTTVYEIGFNAGTARFFQGPNVFHVQTAFAGPFVATPHLKVGARIYNKNGSSETHDVRFRALGMYRVGRLFAVPDFFHVTAIGATTIKSNPGTLHRIVMSRAGGGASSDTITFHDGPTTGFPIIAVIAMSSNDNRSHTFMHTLNDGLTVDLSSAQFDLTVVFD